FQSADKIPLQRIAMSKYVSDLTTVVRVRRLTRLALSSAVLIVFAIHTTIFSQAIKQRSHNVENGERIYKSGCIACHGGDGRGAPETLPHFPPPHTFPHFTPLHQ